jgi:hypothetical protein
VRLNRKQLPLLVILSLLCGILLVAAWLAGKPVEDEDEWQHPLAFATSSPTSTLAPLAGWWDEMPTDPSLPTMPPIALPTETPTRTPPPTRTPNARTQTAVALTNVAITTPTSIGGH